MSQIKIGDYLFSRLRELGVKTVFGVPGGKIGAVTIHACNLN